MSALTHPLSVADGRLWLGAPPVAGGRGIALTTDGVVLHDLDVDPTTIPWSEVTGLEAVVEVSRCDGRPSPAGRSACSVRPWTSSRPGSLTTSG